MVIDLIVLIAISFSVEFVGALYIRAISKQNDRAAMIFSILGSVLGWVVLWVVVSDARLFPGAILGESIGTFMALRVSRQKKI